jgi:hypothetical protein
MTPRKRPVGRPPALAGTPRDSYFQLRMAPIELQALHNAARLCGMSTADYIRWRVGLKCDVQPSAPPMGEVVPLALASLAQGGESAPAPQESAPVPAECTPAPVDPAPAPWLPPWAR